jgi:hypothetical protein
MVAIYALWRAGNQVKLPPQEVFQMLEFGEDVEGLIDLPIKELIQEVRQIFPAAIERAGLVEGASAVGRVSVSWTWQWLRIAGTDLTAAEVEEISQLATRYSCSVFERTSGEF